MRVQTRLIDDRLVLSLNIIKLKAGFYKKINRPGHSERVLFPADVFN